MERLLALEMIRVTEAAAIASARLMGRGDTMEADRVAVEAMRRTFDEIPIDARIVIGEGERDEAPMLYIGERVGDPKSAVGEAPEIDIAVDPLEGTNLVAYGQAGSITVLAATERGGLLNAPDCYMEKLCVGPVVAGKVDITAPPAENLRRIAAALGREVSDITVVILERPRHEALIAEVRAAGARIKLISDGDLAAAISAGANGAPGWVSHLDFSMARTANSWSEFDVALLVALQFLIGVAVYAPRPLPAIGLAVGALTALAFWFVGQQLGQLTSGHATDVNIGPLIVLLAAATLATGTRRYDRGSSALAAGRRTTHEARSRRVFS